ncbi:MAG: imidazole glycerol phosphate synthase subunit HisH, partial [Candidatus Omnitrophica bacterium]|nr:imidazole glycerol phosphate synthase subunit HisH [Candidatus Omnitrophota bacterium]
MIAIIDYGMGNLRSVQKALEKVGATTMITQNPDEIKAADKVVLPGVGAMQPAMQRLKALGIIPAIKTVIAKKAPFLGICLGFQLLFEKSNEGGLTEGLGILRGEVARFSWLKIPQIGWNQLHIKNADSPILKGIDESTNVYFCHSYFVKPADKTIISTTTKYAIDFTSSI